MNIYFATNDKQRINLLLKYQVKNILISYLNKKTIWYLVEKDDLPDINLIIDSGAYSAWTKGELINLGDYISFCKRIAHYKDKFKNIYFVNLDIIPGKFGQRPTQEDREKAAEKGWENFETMKKAGLSVMHVFHQHDDFKWLERLKKEDYIGISPANDLGPKEREQWLKVVFSVIKKKKTHGFGITAFKALTKIPFYSADSSNWITPTRFGCLYYYDNFKVKSYHYRNMKDCLEMKIGTEVISTKGMSLLDLSIKSQLRMEKDLTRLWKEKNIIWSD